MKAKNMFIGQRVQIKTVGTKPRGFFTRCVGKIGTIELIDLGTGLDVCVKFDDGTFDWGRHTGIHKVKED